MREPPADGGPGDTALVGVISNTLTFRYRLALVADGECVLRYDNEAGKGDHRHVGEKEERHRFRSAEQLLADFWADVEIWRR